MDESTAQQRVPGVTDRAALLAELDHVMATRQAGSLLIGELADHLMSESFGRPSEDAVLRLTGKRADAAVRLHDVTAPPDADRLVVPCFHTEPRKPCPGIFDQSTREIAISILRRISELRHAIAAAELVLHYQPIVNLSSGRTVGYESLLRWHHPREGLLAAGSFVDMLESSRLVSELTPRIVAEACSAAAALAAASTGIAPFVSVNLSGPELSQTGIADLVQDELRHAGIKPEQLTIELTETAAITDQATAVSTLNTLTGLGVRVALDDFGTGHSSLVRLKRLPVTTVKIDKDFVTNLTRDADDLAIVTSMVKLAASLRCTTTAEGVETREQALTLRELGCDHAQGHLYSPAQPLDQLLRRQDEIRKGREARTAREAAAPGSGPERSRTDRPRPDTGGAK